MSKEKKSYSKKELRNEYGVSHTTWYKWITPLIQKGLIRNGQSRIYTPKEVSIIFEHLGEP